MDGYQPKDKCTNCLAFNICNKKHKNKVCKNYKECRPAPPKTGSNVNITTQRNVPPMPEVKPMVPLEVSRETYESLREKGLLNPNVLYSIKEKQCTVLSVRDFAILYEIADRKLSEIESDIRQLGLSKEEAITNPYYQDLIRIRDKLGELNIEVETPSMGVEE